MNFMNEIVDINCISKSLTKKWNLQDIDEILVKMNNFDVDNKFSINMYQMKMNVRDDKSNFFISMQKFYSFQNLMYFLIVNLSWMMKSNSHVHWLTMTWRYIVKKNRLKLNTFEDFTTVLENDVVSMYALICFIRISDETSTEVSIEIKTFEDVFFFKSTTTLLSHDEHDHAIDLMSNKISLFEFLYNMFQTELEVLQKYIRENLALNQIRHSIVDVDAFVLFTLKKNEELRLCVNYRDLNVVTIKNRVSLSFIDETLNRLVEAVYFIKLNLKNAYYHIKIKANDEWKIAFRTRYELFEYAMMLFELTNASTIFQFLMNKILAKLMNRLCVLFLDDILIYFRTKKKHWRHVRAMLKRLRKFNLFVNLIKCRFMQQSIEFLNYIINSKNIFMNMKRVDSIKSWSVLDNLRELQVFLDFANFYRKFIVKYAKMSRSLFELLKDNKNEKQIDEFVWNEETMTTFKKFIRMFIEIFMLIHFDSNNQTMIEIDVSDFAIAEIIFQLMKSLHIESQTQWHSIVFYSRKMIFVEIKYSTHDQKLLVIVESFK